MEKIKNLEEYRLGAARTLADLGSEDKNILHLEAGVTGELMGEVVDILKKTFAYNKPLDKVHLGEELADASWYAVGAITLNKGSFLMPNVVDFIRDLEGAFIEAEVLKGAMEATEDTDKVEAVLHFLLSNKQKISILDLNATLSTIIVCRKLCEVFGLDYLQVLTNNLNKLKVRYPEKYSDEAAVNRDLQAERAELEK